MTTAQELIDQVEKEEAEKRLANFKKNQKLKVDWDKITKQVDSDIQKETKQMLRKK